MTEDEYRERASRGEFLTEDEKQVLVQAEALLYPTVRNHWDVAACWCPLCRAHSHIVKATLVAKEAELEARKQAEKRRIVLEPDRIPADDEARG